jgi:hypothetical protein
MSIISYNLMFNLITLIFVIWIIFTVNYLGQAEIVCAFDIKPLSPSE